jgi:hypothetical protein
MTREEVIRMARRAGAVFPGDGSYHTFERIIDLEHFAFLVTEAEREACAKVAGWLWQQFQDTKEAHERNSPEPFRPEQFGFDQSTVQQSKRFMDAICARGQL